MQVTVKEAKSRICPMGMEDGEGQSTCYGQERMGWRWLDGAEVAEDERRERWEAAISALCEAVEEVEA